MASILILGGYLLSVVAAAYLIGRFGDSDLAVFAVLWPLWVPVALMMSALQWLADKGEEHQQ